MPEKCPENSEILKQIIDSLSVLDEDSRNRLLKCVLTYFEFESSGLGANGSVKVSVSQSANREPSFGNRPSLSPKDFMHQKDPKTDVERVTCLAYYLSNYRDIRHFKTEDISALNTEAAQFKLSNPSFTVQNAVKAGLLATAGGGKKQIGIHGEKVVLALPDREKVREILKSVKRRISKKKAKSDIKNNHAIESE